METRKLLMIIAEAVLEKNLIADIKASGAHRYTITEARGGEHAGDWEFSRLIEIKVICANSIADALAHQILYRYCAHYTVTMFIAEGEVLRPEKF